MCLLRVDLNVYPCALVSCPTFLCSIEINFSVFMCLLARRCLSWPGLISKRDYCLNANTLVKQRINDNINVYPSLWVAGLPTL